MKCCICLIAMLAWTTAAAAQDEAHQAAGFDVFASSDADHSDVLKLGLAYDFHFTDLDHYQGVRVESFTFSARGTHVSEARGYFQFAGSGGDWNWNGFVGTDGRSALGSGSIYKEGPIRQEYIASRDLVETPLGVRRHLYATFAGAAYDFTLDDRDIVTALVGVQKFDGHNWRTHMRGRYIYVVAPDWGLSAQLRLRSFWDSAPREYDYFSPRWYAEAIPTLQLRRFYARWQYLVAVGWGVRRNTGSGWRSAALANAQIISPVVGRDWYLKADFTYSSMPVSAGYSYNYEQATLSVIRSF